MDKAIILISAILIKQTLLNMGPSLKCLFINNIVIKIEKVITMQMRIGER